MTIQKYSLGNLEFDFDDLSGQILKVHDSSLDMTVIEFDAGHELEINKHALPLRLSDQDESKNADFPDPAWQCNLQGSSYSSAGAGWAFNVFRQVVVGSACKPTGNHLNAPNCLHIRYRLERKVMDKYDTDVPLFSNKRPMQVPLWLDTIGTLCAKTDWFGADTKMIAAHMPGAGPRSHVSLEEGAPDEVTEHLWNMFRRTHPGVQLIPGAIYTHPDGRWLWITAQRPTVGMHWDFNASSQKAQFEYHARLTPADVVHTPEVSLYWGTGGEAEMFARLNDAFIAYEEPPKWWWNTCWHWMNWWCHRENGIDDMADHAEYLHEKLGLTGFGLMLHDLRPGSWDCSASGLRPSPHLGGDEAIRRFGERVKSFGGKIFIWMPYLGLGEPSLDIRPDWVVRGEDGRPFETYGIGSFDLYQGLNFGHPEVQDYYLEWIKRYITEYQIDGIFWDCGGTPSPPDFSSPETRSFQRFPSENMTAGYRFMEKVMLAGRSYSKDFFMWHEAFNADLPGMGYGSSKGDDGFIAKLNRYGKKRLVYRSKSTYDLYGGFPRIIPEQDSGFEKRPVSLETYKPVIEDKMNQWLVNFVKENGVRDAQWVANGVSYCAGHIVTDPADQPYEVTIPRWMTEAKKLVNVFTNESIKPSGENESGTTFILEGKAAYAVQQD
ncbi:MAG: hypothetical protein MJH11_01735 [Lentisphaeria bacterium]|nr:hypothetical protein [Lentisphaeria bacterium]